MWNISQWTSWYKDVSKTLKYHQPERWLPQLVWPNPRPQWPRDFDRQSRKSQKHVYRPTMWPRLQKQRRRWRHLTDSTTLRRTFYLRQCCLPILVSLRWYRCVAVHWWKSTDLHQPSTHIDTVMRENAGQRRSPYIFGGNAVPQWYQDKGERRYSSVPPNRLAKMQNLHRTKECVNTICFNTA